LGSQAPSRKIFRSRPVGEAVARIGELLAAIERPKAKERQAKAGPKSGKDKKRSGGGNLPQALGKTRDAVGAAVGLGQPPPCFPESREKRRAVVRSVTGLVEKSVEWVSPRDTIAVFSAFFAFLIVAVRRERGT